MPVRLKVTALATCVLAVLFYLFFQISKQNAALEQVNVFADDPYDAVGSFGVQLALLAAFVALVRAFRPYQSIKVLDGQKWLLLRAEYVTCQAVAVTLVADVVAMIRHSALWIDFSAGQLLAALTGGMLLLTVLVGWLIRSSARTLMAAPVQGMWIRVMLIFAVDVLILAFYPENWRQSVAGELFTVVVGIVILFVTVRIVAIALSPYTEPHFEDVLDDLASIYRWLKAHVGSFAVLFQLVEVVVGLPPVHVVLNWLNPRKHAWNLVILVGVLMGIELVLAEMLAEGGPAAGRFVLIVAIFIFLECAGVLIGYALLAKPLGLFRQDFSTSR